MKKILLIDGFGFIFKAYYAFINRPLTNKYGENTSSIFGFFKSILAILKKERPDYFLIALEGEGECFRNDIYPDYKANRPPAPEDLKSQIIKIIDLIKKLEIPNLSINGYEADDIIGTISKKFADNTDNRVLIFSSDKDLRQLVNDRVIITNTDRFSNDIIILDEKKIKDDMGINPSQVVDYLALTGDSSDNIPGVKGIGPKSAVELLSKYNTIEELYKNIDNVESKSIKDKLIKNKDNAFLSKRLAQIKKDIPYNFNWEDYKARTLNLANAINILEDNGLKSIIDGIKEYNSMLNASRTMFDDVNQISVKEDFNKTTNPIKNDYKVVTNIDELKEVIKEIKNYEEFCFDLETTGFDFLNDRIICISMTYESTTVVIPLELSKKQEKQLGITINRDYSIQALSMLKTIFNDDKIIKIGHNLKFDIKFLKNNDIEVVAPLFDTMLAEYCLDAANNILNMDDLASKYLSVKTIHYEDLVKVSKKETLLDVEFNKLTDYSAQDAFITYGLYKVLKNKIETDEKISRLFYEIEMPLMQVLIDMEYEGVSINSNYLKTLSKQLDNEINEIYNHIIELAGFEFNPNSPKQLAEILFDKLKLPIIKKTKTGPSTDVEVLNKLSYIHPLAGLLLEYRTLTKIKSTYSDTLPQLVNKASNKIHTTYLQTGTQTGRLSSKNPNLQNIPVKTELGRKIRKAFIPDPDCLLVSADYSQIELFLLAELSRDENLFNAFKKNEDIHTITASYIFNKNPDEITKEERNSGKTINFSILYGQGPHRLSENLKISRKDAANFINIYFSKYNGVSKYMEEIKEKCRKQGYAETLWGRKRSIPEINDKNKMIQANGERIAVNTTIQGTAADLMKVAMIKIYEKFKKENIKSKIIMQVHDELIFNVIKNEKEKVIAIVKECMEQSFNFSLKLRAEITVGDNWGEL
jgi:DNA polymerase-1